MGSVTFKSLGVGRQGKRQKKERERGGKGRDGKGGPFSSYDLIGVSRQYFVFPRPFIYYLLRRTEKNSGVKRFTEPVPCEKTVTTRSLKE